MWKVKFGGREREAVGRERGGGREEGEEGEGNGRKRGRVEARTGN